MTRKRKAAGRKLAIEMVPEGAWDRSLRKRLRQSYWDKIRKQAYAASGHRCAVCGAEGRLSCHEVWDYDDADHIQRLAGFVALCALCHAVKHLGMARILAGKGALDYDEVVRHYASVNGVTKKDFEGDNKQAGELWAKRSEHEWTTDYGEYQRIFREGAKEVPVDAEPRRGMVCMKEPCPKCGHVFPRPVSVTRTEIICSVCGTKLEISVGQIMSHE